MGERVRKADSPVPDSCTLFRNSPVSPFYWSCSASLSRKPHCSPGAAVTAGGNFSASPLMHLRSLSWLLVPTWHQDVRPVPWERPFSRTGEHANQQHWQVVLATGKSDLGVLGLPPENFLVRPHVPQLEVLQHSSVFLTHGGMNSVMEGLYYGVPLVVIPQMLEQSITAKRVEELGLGIALESNAMTVDLLQEAITRVASKPEFSTRVQHMRDIIRESGGCRSAADAIIQFSRTTGQRLWGWPPRIGHPS